MTLRQKLFLLLSGTILSAVAAVAFASSWQVSRVFAALSHNQTAALIARFHRDNRQQAAEVEHTLGGIAQSLPLNRMAARLSHGDNPARYVLIAPAVAQQYHLDYLEIVGHDGSIISSAQWPARIGSRDRAIAAAGKSAFLKQEDLPDGNSPIGLFAVREVAGSSPPLYLIGGRQIYADSSPDIPGSHLWLYRNITAGFDARNFAFPAAELPVAQHSANLIERALSTNRLASGVLDLQPRQDSMDVTAVPLAGARGSVPAVLIVAISRRGLVMAQNVIRNIALLVAALGILVAFAAAFWMAACVARPLRQISCAAAELGAGNWEARVDIRAPDEMGILGRAFNQMIRQLAEQRDRLVQNERVAAWRELGQRLAEELKMPLFPLQVTIENMMRARHLPRLQFDAVFDEGIVNLQAELANLRAIIGRFSDFSRSPDARLESLDAREVLRGVMAFYTPTLEERHIEVGISIGSDSMPILGDAEMLHGALSSLILRAMDAMPDGGTLTVSTARILDTVRFSVADSGGRLTPEERERLFTPYHGGRNQQPGLGLALVQSVINDHRGSIAVEVSDSGGTRFVITFPLEQRLLAAPKAEA